MTEEAVLETVPAARPNKGKWIAEISADQSVCEVAERFLGARLEAVCRCLPLAAQRSDDDAEHVHRLRIAARRAVEAIRVFSGLMEEADAETMRDRLRRIRLAADEARNWDVLAQRFSQGGDAAALLLEAIRVRRRDAQGPILAAHETFVAEDIEARFEEQVRKVASHVFGEGKRRFARQAPAYLAPVVKKFFRAAKADLSDDAAMHALRIRAKKLRYTMEILAPAFGTGFRKKLYARVSLFQELLGAINDHATALAVLGDWRTTCEDARQKAFLEGVLLAEVQATGDLRAAFRAAWTPKAATELERRLRAYC